MPIEIRMPALSPTMEAGTLARWLVKAGDEVRSGDLIAEIETDKATMEFEAVDEGTIGRILIAEGAENIAVGTVIAVLDDEGNPAVPTALATSEPVSTSTPDMGSGHTEPAPAPTHTSLPARTNQQRKRISPLARRLAAIRGIDITAITGSGPSGRIIKSDLDRIQSAGLSAHAELAPTPVAGPLSPRPVSDIPHTVEKLSGMRKVIARRLTESKQTVPHIYLTVDIRIDALLELRGELNRSLDTRGVKVSVNDLLIKALAVSLMQVPNCNVMFTPDQLVSFTRADISVAVSVPSGLITPIIEGADGKGIARISTEMKDLASRAREQKLKPTEYQGGTASISNMGMMGIKQFEAVINPPQAMIMAIGAGEQRPCVVDGKLIIATVMSATGSFDHRAIDGADGAELMMAFKSLVEAPLAMLA